MRYWIWGEKEVYETRRRVGHVTWVACHFRSLALSIWNLWLEYCCVKLLCLIYYPKFLVKLLVFSSDHSFCETTLVSLSLLEARERHGKQYCLLMPLSQVFTILLYTFRKYQITFAFRGELFPHCSFFRSSLVVLSFMFWDIMIWYY